MEVTKRAILLTPYRPWDTGFILTLYGDKWQGNEFACVWIEAVEMDRLIEEKKAKVI